MKKDEIAKLVKTGIDELNSALASGHSVRMTDVLKLMARFHKYSFNNCVLIAEQFPDATRVMGFHGWKGVGRSVKKGEKGIGITAPLAVRKKDVSADEMEIRGFRVVHVFDISQTEGEELPRLAQPTGDATQWIEPVERLIAGGTGCSPTGVRNTRGLIWHARNPELIESRVRFTRMDTCTGLIRIRFWRTRSSLIRRQLAKCFTR